MIIEINDPSRIIGADLAGTCLRGLYSTTALLRDVLQENIRERTPYYTGALQLDETGTFNTEPSNPELVHMFAGTENQLAAPSMDGVSRVYVDAIELGSPSNPYNPTEGHLMYEKGTIDDIPDIEEWGVNGINKGVSDIVSGRSLRL